MEGLFEAGRTRKLAIIGQPNVAARRLENPVVVPQLLSFLAYGTFGSTVHALNDFPEVRVARTAWSCSTTATTSWSGSGTLT